MNSIDYEELIKNGKKLKNGTIRIIIPCSPLAISYHNESIHKFLKQSEYKLINLDYEDRFRKIIGYVKRRETK